MSRRSRRSSGSSLIDAAEGFREIPFIYAVGTAALAIVLLELVVPWWVGRGQASSAGTFDIAKSFLPLAQIIGWILVALILIYGLVGAVNRRFDGWLDTRRLNRQKGLESIRQLSWQEFERLLAEAYRRQGFEVVQRGGPRADGGADLELHKYGEVLLVQAKHWRTRAVRLPQVRELWGAVADEHADGAILVTSGWLTSEARHFTKGKNLTLLDGPELAAMITQLQRTGVERHDPSEGEEGRICPSCGRPMALRVARKGASPGQQFWGCTGFPQCRNTAPYIPTAQPIVGGPPISP
jgi:restriction system protein